MERNNTKNRGSEWNKWDLHVHTPYTRLENEYKNIEPSGFVKKIVESGLKVVGLTNYFKFADNEIFGENSLKRQLEESGIVVFPNIELRIGNVNKADQLGDYHLIFKPDIRKREIDLLMSNLDVHMANGKKLKLASLSDIGLKSKSIYVDFENLMRTLEDDSLGLRDSVLRGFLSRGHGETRSASLADRIEKMSHFVLHSSDSERSIQQDYIFWTTNMNKDIKPIFQGSDAHKLKDIGEKFTWVKAKASFGGLMQTLFSPHERIRFQEEKPSDSKSPGMLIDKIVYNGKEIPFNPDLTSIIGKRGNGKSILLKAISSKIAPDDFADKLQDRIDSDIRWRDKVFGEKLNIVWNDGALNGGTNDNPKKIFYLPQGYLSNLAYDENIKSDERDHFIVSLLRKNEAFDRAEKRATVIVAEIRDQIEKNIDKLIMAREGIEKLTEENRDYGSLENLRNDLAVIESKIKAISNKHKITDEDIRRYQNAIRGERKWDSVIQTARQDIEILQKIKKSEYHNIVNMSSSLLFGLSNDVRKTIDEALERTGNDALRKVVDSQLTILQSKQANAEKELKKCNDVISSLKKIFEQQEELKSLSNDKVARKRDIETVQRNTEIISEKKKDIAETIKQIKNAYFSYEKVQSDIFSTVKFGNFDFIDIGVKIARENKQLSIFIDDNINKINIGKTGKFFHLFLADEKHNIDKNNFEEIFKDIAEGKAVLLKSTKNDIGQVLKELLRNPYHIDFLSSITTKGADTEFRDMTGGQKAIAMLELIFTFDQNRYPILLDQPEDDLDTAGVATSVVDFIKKQKEKRQIIIVSHNGSLVVCSDSEEIIVAENINNHFRYIVGAMEEDITRKNIVDILEGGEEALRLRMKKLDISLT